MTSAVLGLYYGNYGSGHVYASLFMPATQGKPAHETLLSFDGFRFLSDENPLACGVFLPITTEVGQKILDSYTELQGKVRLHHNPFYHTVDGTRIPEFETGEEPREATNCFHYILTLCKQVGIPLAAISESLCPTFNAGQLETIIDEQLKSPGSFTNRHGTTGKLKEVATAADGERSQLFYFGFPYERAISYGFDDVTLPMTDAHGKRYERHIIDYLSQQPPLVEPVVSAAILPEKIQKILETGPKSVALGAAEPSNPCHKR